MIYAYARVSDPQSDTIDNQIAELTAAGAERIFAEKISGAARKNRPQLIKMMKGLSPGDVLLVTRLDRLARSTRDLLNLLAEIAERGATFRSLREGWADTTTPVGRFVATILGGVAEFERELIRSRTSDGARRARERGVKFGRPRKLNAYQSRKAAMRLASGESASEIGRDYGVAHSTILRLDGRIPLDEFRGQA